MEFGPWTPNSIPRRFHLLFGSYSHNDLTSHFPKLEKQRFVSCPWIIYRTSLYYLSFHSLTWLWKCFENWVNTKHLRYLVNFSHLECIEHNGPLERGQTKYILDSILIHQTLLNRAPKSIIHYTTYKHIIESYILQLIRQHAPHCTKYHDPQQTCLWQGISPTFPLPPTPPPQNFVSLKILDAKYDLELLLEKQ
jgi:hypothetical protein